MSRLKKLLVNKYEIATEESLQRAVSKQDGRVFTKVRLADVVEINKSGLSNDEFSYALKSHFDFVVTDAEFNCKFAVEFDESHHQHDVITIKRDQLKNAICDKLDVPLLRIDEPYLRRVKRFAAVLDWIVEMWYMEQAWNDAYERGELPWDADFDPFLIFEWGYIDSELFVPVDTKTTSPDQLAEVIKQGKRLTWCSYDPFVEYINTVRKLWGEKVCLDPFPEFVENTDFGNGYSVAIAFVRIPNNRFIAGEVRCRVSNFITRGFEITRNLAIVDCVYKLLQFKQGNFKGISLSEIEMLKANIQTRVPK